MGRTGLIYLAPDIDISKNEWWKAHVLWEVKYFQNYYDKVFLISKNEKKIKLWDSYKNVVFFRMPNWLHHPLSRLLPEPFFFFFMAFILRINWYKYLLERSYRLWWWFSIFFCMFWWHSVFEMIEPVYYESYIMPIQNFIIKIMSLFKHIVFFWTYDTFKYNLPEKKYVNWWTGADLELIWNKKDWEKKKYDVIYIWSVAKWHNLSSVMSIMKDNPEWKFLFITSSHDENLTKQKKELKLDNLYIMENVKNFEIYNYITQCKIWLALYEKNNELLKKFDYFYSPIKVHEYKACWLPVIATNIWTLKELCWKTWILIDNSEKELYEAINTLLTDKKSYDKFSKNAENEAIEKYNWNCVCKYISELLK